TLLSYRSKRDQGSQEKQHGGGAHSQRVASNLRNGMHRIERWKPAVHRGHHQPGKRVGPDDVEGTESNGGVPWSSRTGESGLAKPTQCGYAQEQNHRIYADHADKHRAERPPAEEAAKS